MENRDVFSKEYEAAARAKNVAEKGEDVREIRNELSKIIFNYEKILNETSKMTRISDRLYKKLATANDLIEEQKNELAVVNEELVAAQKLVRKEVKKIVQIQQSLLPEKMPENIYFESAAKYKASVDAGGDYYDIISLGSKKFGVCIADVSGHGVHAAVLMAMTRMGVNICALLEERPSKFMERLDKILIENIKTGDFVSLFYGIIDFEEKRFTVSNGGHLPFFKYSPLTKKAEDIYIGKGHLLGLGIFEDVSFTEESISIDSGEILIFLTDGIAEAMNESRELYGFERIKSSIEKWADINTGEFIEGIISDVIKFAGNDEFNDDITIVAIKIK